MDKLHTRRPVDLAADQLRSAILANEFPAGTRLPPERQLADTLGINRLTLRAALARLEAEGLVRARQGSGVHVLDYHRSAGVDVLRHLVAEGRLDLLRPFLELRRAVATEAVALACSRATESGLVELDALVDQLEQEEDQQAFAEGDLAFSRAVLRAARNLPMEMLFNTVGRVFEAHPELAEAMHADRAAVLASYRTVLALIRLGDPDVARTAVRTALEAMDALTLERMEAP